MMSELLGWLVIAQGIGALLVIAWCLVCCLPPRVVDRMQRRLWQ